MNTREIKTALERGDRVFWVHNGYEVMKDSLGQYLIKCHDNGHCVGLTHQDGETLNGKEKEFFSIPARKKTPARAFVVVNDGDAVGVFETHSAAMQYAMVHFDDFIVNDCPIFER
jgi:hypothetical protein